MVPVGTEHVLAITRDVTEEQIATREQERAREVARSREELVALLVEHFSFGVGYYTPEGRLKYFNRVALEYMDVRKEEVEGKLFSELYPPDRRKSTWSASSAASQARHRRL